MLAQKTFHDGSTEIWVWDGLALIRRGSDIYVNEPHVSGGVPILSKTDEGVRYHEHDFLGTTIWSMDTKGNLVKDYQDTTIFGEGSIQKDRSARFTGKPYDEDLQAYVFPYRNYDASTARWRSSDPAGYPDGINQHFYAAVPTYALDPLGCWIVRINSFNVGYPNGTEFKVTNETDKVNIALLGHANITFSREEGDEGVGFMQFNIRTISGADYSNYTQSLTISENESSVTSDLQIHGLTISRGIGNYSFSITLDFGTSGKRTDTGTFSIVER